MIEILKTDAATIILWLLNAVWVAVGFLMRSIFVQKKDFVELEKEVSEVKNNLENLPNMDEMHKLSLSIKDLTGDLSVVDERLKSFDKLSDRMQKQLDIMDGYLRKLKK